MTDLELLVAAAENPAYGRVGRANAAAALARYIAGQPLVRKHRRIGDGWSWLCPVPTCQDWRMGHPTEEGCRDAWLEHATVKHPEIAPSWPPVRL